MSFPRGTRKTENSAGINSPGTSIVCRERKDMSAAAAIAAFACVLAEAVQRGNSGAGGGDLVSIRSQ